MKYLGEYKELENNSNFPMLEDNISDVPCTSKDVILLYLKNNDFIKGAMPSLKHDIFSNEIIPGDCLYYSDGTFSWDYETIYYFEKYNMKLPDDFINHVLKI